MHVWTAAAVAALFFGGTLTAPPPSARPPASADTRQQPSQTANEELIKLAVAGMGDDILLAVVAKTDKAKYDTSADALLKLKSAGVSQRVMAAILGVAPPAAAAVAPIVPPAQSLATPPRPGRASAPPPAGSAPDNVDPNLPTTAEATAATNLRFSVFVSAPQRDGFFDTNKDIQDSIKDLRDKLSKEKNVNLTITDDRKNADVILTVVKRGMGNQAYGQRVEFQEYYGGASLEHVPMMATSYWVSAMMQVGAY